MTDKAANAGTPPPLPDWFPAWSKQLADLYFSGTTCLFLLHGNVHDFVRVSTAGGDAWCNLPEFLATQLFGNWDVVLHYDLGRGLRPLAGSDPTRLQSMIQRLSARIGDPGTWPRDPDQTLALLDRFLERSLVDENEAKKRVAIVFGYSQYLVPAGDLASMARGDASRLVRLLGWAQNPYLKRANVAFCLVADKLTELNDRLVQSAHSAAIQVPLPDVEERRRYALAARGGGSERIADLTSGLSLVNLSVLLSTRKQNGEAAEAAGFRQLKKELIERQCQGLVEFVEPKHTLDLVVGHAAARQRLIEDARWIGEGRFEAAPMGYLITGPVGTGKTFLAECYAGTIGIPCVKLRNFRSKYVGETEGNLEQVLTVLRSLGPVVVIIDEADAALGSRRAEGDSGTSSRVFSMIASQMGDTNYRGKIVWMLLTSRPDLLPIDLKRQGRAEVHIPLFYPDNEEELRAMFQAMARKNKLPLAADAVGGVSVQKHLSGADVESLVLAANRIALAAGRNQVERPDIEQALAEFLPSAQGLEKEMQELAAVLECTQQSFLTDDWRKKIAEPDGRTRLQERLVAIRQLIEE